MWKRSRDGDKAETPDLLFKSATCSRCLWSGTLRPPVPNYRADPTLHSGGHKGAGTEELPVWLSHCAMSTGTAFGAAEEEHVAPSLSGFSCEHRQAESPQEQVTVCTPTRKCTMPHRRVQSRDAAWEMPN